MTRATARPQPPIRMLLVDDSRKQREGWALTLGSQPDLEIVGQAGDGAHALTLARRGGVDVVLMDIQMPRVNGLVATERMRRDPRVLAHGPAPRVILVTGFDLDAFLAAAAEAGAFAVLYKDAEPESLFDAIRQAAAAREPV